MNLLELQMKAEAADKMKAEIVELKRAIKTARGLMLDMDRRYKSLKGEEFRQRSFHVEARWKALHIYEAWWFRFLPKSVKNLVEHCFYA